MSSEARDWVNDNMVGWTRTEKLIALRVADKAQKNSGHTCTLDVDGIAEYAECSVRTVQRVFKALHGKVLTVERAAGRGNLNTFCFPQLTGKGDTGVTFSGVKKVTPVSAKGDTGVIRSIYEPVLTVDEEDDEGARLRNELVEIVGNRTLTPGERAFIDSNSKTEEGRKSVARVLSRLDRRYPDLDIKGDVTAWMATTLKNLGVERDESTHRRTKYQHAEPHIVETPIDNLRIDHLAELEPLPPPAPKQPHEEYWEEAQQRFLHEYRGVYAGLFQHTRVASADGNLVVLHAPNERVKDQLTDRWASICKRTLKSIAQRDLDVVFEVAQ